MNVDQIKAHPFFYGVDWTAIRQIDAPFVPHLRSIVDTSYFPTEEYENVPDQPVGADTSDAKDLAFLGCANIHRPVSRKDVSSIVYLLPDTRSSASMPTQAECRIVSRLAILLRDVFILRCAVFWS